MRAELEVAVDKRVSMEEKKDLFTPELRGVCSELAESLALSEVVLGYKKAHQTLMNDQETLQLISEASELQRKLYAGGSTSSHHDDDIARMRDLQGLLSTNTVLQQQAIARETAVAFIREINQEISQLIGFDFASLATRPGAGC